MVRGGGGPEFGGKKTAYIILERSLREVFGHFMSVLGHHGAGGSVPSVELMVGNIVALFHALFLSSCLGSVATPTSGNILLGIDFGINLIFKFKFQIQSSLKNLRIIKEHIVLKTKPFLLHKYLDRVL